MVEHSRNLSGQPRTMVKFRGDSNRSRNSLRPEEFKSDYQNSVRALINQVTSASDVEDELTKFGITSEIFSSGNTRKQLAANSSSWAELCKIDITVRYSITPVENDYGFGFSLDYLRQLQKIEKPSLVILHQVYTLSTFLGYRYARKNGIPYAVFPHGSLTNYDEANSSLKKAIAKRVVISKILREASVIIVTCESEKADLQKSIQSKAVLLPYGAELKNELLEKRIASGGDSQYPRILFSGRFDKKKNLPLLLAAMPQIISKFPHAVLDIAGSGSKRDVDVLLNLAHQLKIESNVCISQRAMISSGGHNFRTASLEFRHKPIHIAEGAWICMDAKVLPGVVIGKCSVVSAGEIARDLLPDFSMLVSGKIRSINPPK